jgi:hypothetical protein
MSYSIDKDKALKAANSGIENINNSRKAELESAISREIANSEKWNRRFPWFCKKINREEALSRIKSSDGWASEYWLITKLSYGRAHNAYQNIKAACDNSSTPTVLISDDDFDCLKTHL